MYSATNCLGVDSARNIFVCQSEVGTQKARVAYCDPVGRVLWSRVVSQPGISHVSLTACLATADGVFALGSAISSDGTQRVLVLRYSKEGILKWWHAAVGGWLVQAQLAPDGNFFVVVAEDLYTFVVSKFSANYNPRTDSVLTSPNAFARFNGWSLSDFQLKVAEDGTAFVGYYGETKNDWQACISRINASGAYCDTLGLGSTDTGGYIVNINALQTNVEPDGKHSAVVFGYQRKPDDTYENIAVKASFAADSAPVPTPAVAWSRPFSFSDAYPYQAATFANASKVGDSVVALGSQFTTSDQAEHMGLVKLSLSDGSVQQIVVDPTKYTAPIDLHVDAGRKRVVAVGRTILFWDNTQQTYSYGVTVNGYDLDTFSALDFDTSRPPEYYSEGVGHSAMASDGGVYACGIGIWKNSLRVSLTRFAPDELPVDDIRTFRNTAVSGAAPGVRANDTLYPGIFSVLASGLEGQGFQLYGDGYYVYTPPKGFTGAQTYEYFNKGTTWISGTRTIAVTVEMRNQAPVAVSDLVYVRSGRPQNLRLLVNDYDPDGDAPLQAVSVSAPAHGTVAILNSAGVFSYTSVAGFVGRDTFSYTLADALGATSIGVVTVWVGESGDSDIQHEDFSSASSRLGSDQFNDTAFDSVGNAWAVGYYTPSPYPSFYPNGTDTWGMVRKFSPAGDILLSIGWYQPQGGGISFDKVTTRSDDSFVAAGTWKQPGGDKDIHVASVSVDLSSEAEFTYTSVGNDVVRDLMVDASGAALIGGRTNGKPTVIKLDPNLQQVWVKAFPDQQGLVSRVLDGGDGRIFVTGDRGGHGFVALLDATGAEVWRRALPSMKRVTDAYLDVTGLQIVVAGILNDDKTVAVITLQRDNGALVRSDTVFSNVTADPKIVGGKARYTAETPWETYVVVASEADDYGTVVCAAQFTYWGEKRWDKTFYTIDGQYHQISDLAADKWGDIYVTGGVANVEEDGYGYDILTMAIDPDGDLIWVRKTDGSASDQDYGWAIASTPDGRLAVAGMTTSYGSGQDQWFSLISQAPHLKDEEYIVNQGERLDVDWYRGVGRNDTLRDGLFYATSSLPGSGSFSPRDGSFSYEPAPDTTGWQELKYYMDKPGWPRQTATAYILVQPNSGRPVAKDDAYTVPEGVPTVLNVLENDTDPNGDFPRIESIGTVFGPTGGTAVISSNKILFTATTGGNYNFTYTVTDGKYRGTAQVNVTLSPNPIISSLSPAAVKVGRAFTLLVNSIHRFGDSPGAEILWNGSPKLTTWVSDSRLTASFAAGEVTEIGTASVKVRVRDGRVSNEKTVTIQDAILANPDRFTALESENTNMSVLENDHVAPGRSLSLVSVTSPHKGTAVIFGNQISYKSNAGVVGADSFRYTITDGTDTSTATVTVDLSPNPIITGLAPNPIRAGRETTLMVTGRGFGASSGAEVQWNGSPRTTTWLSSTKLAVTIPVTDVTMEGKALITVRLPDKRVSNVKELQIVGTPSIVIYGKRMTGADTVSITITNNGTGTAVGLKVTSALLAGYAADSSRLPSGVNLAPGQSFAFDVAFDSKAFGKAASGQLVLTISYGGTTVTKSTKVIFK